METERRLVRAADGRDIEFVATGPQDGLPLMVHAGTPIGLFVNTRLAQRRGADALTPFLEKEAEVLAPSNAIGRIHLSDLCRYKHQDRTAIELTLSI